MSTAGGTSTEPTGQRTVPPAIVSGMAHASCSRLIKGFAILAAILLQVPGTGLQASDEPSIATPNLDHLERVQPGWTIVADDQSEASGSIRMERRVWPMFYLHWWPWEESLGPTVSAAAAAERVAGIWEGLEIDSPLEGQEIELPQHHRAILFETTISKGIWKTRYVVWYCPESLRVFVADANLSLTMAAPEELLDWQMEIVRSVRCHTTADVGEHELLTWRQVVPGVELTLALPTEWSLVPGYRIQTVFGGSNFKASEMPKSTALRGQALFVARDAVREFSLHWSSEEDFPMSYDVLQQKIEDFWRPRAMEMMILGSSVQGRLWKMDGVAAYVPDGLPFYVPACRFRGWMWRDVEVTYFAIGCITPTRIGRRDPEYDWVESFERMFKDLGL